MNAIGGTKVIEFAGGVLREEMPGKRAGGHTVLRNAVVMVGGLILILQSLQCLKVLSNEFLVVPRVTFLHSLHQILS